MKTGRRTSWPWTQLWPWVTGIIAVVVFLVPWSIMRVGYCVDYVQGQGESYCTSGPAVGEPAAPIIAAVSALLIVYFLYRMVRILVQRIRSRRHPGTTSTGQ